MVRRRRVSPSAVVLAVLVAAALAVLLLPDTLHIARLPLVAAITAPRLALTLVVAALALIVSLVALVARRSRPASVPLAVVLVAGLVVGAPVVLARGLTVDAGAATAPGLRIVSWNTNGDLVGPADVARVAADQHADVLVLPEIFADRVGEYQEALADRGLVMTPHVGPSVRRATVVFVGARAGSYTGEGAPAGGAEQALALTPTSSASPALLAIHAAHPTLTTNRSWRHDLAYVESRCAEPDTIVVGDLNTTLDGLGGRRIGSCTDAAATAGSASVGTWPTFLPWWLAMPIDHVLVGSGWRTTAFAVLTGYDRDGARHRPIVAVVERAGG